MFFHLLLHCDNSGHVVKRFGNRNVTFELLSNKFNTILVKSRWDNTGFQKEENEGRLARSDTIFRDSSSDQDLEVTIWFLDKYLYVNFAVYALCDSLVDDINDFLAFVWVNKTDLFCGSKQSIDMLIWSCYFLIWINLLLNINGFLLYVRRNSKAPYPLNKVISKTEIFISASSIHCPSK